MPRVLCVKDSRSFSEMLEVILSQQADLEVVGHAYDVDTAVAMVRSQPVDVVVMDQSLAGPDGVEGVRRVKQVSPGTRVVVLAGSPTLELLVRVAAAGADGFMAEDDSLADILDSVRSTATGIDIREGTLDAIRQRVHPDGRTHGQRWDPHLTERERDVLGLLAEGLDPQRIAVHLGITAHTARSYVRNLLAKLGAHTQLEAVITAARCGIVTGLCCCEHQDDGHRLHVS